MRKIILIITIVLISTITYAQTSPVTSSPDSLNASSQKAFKADPNKTYTIQLALNTQAISVLTATPEDWKQIKTSPKFTGEQITQLEQLADVVRKLILQQQQNQIQKDYEKFLAEERAKHTIIKNK
jgi:hypothetical protein